MKKLLSIVFTALLLSTVLSSCNTSESVDEMEIKNEQTQGNDKVVRKKPGRS